MSRRRILLVVVAALTAVGAGLPAWAFIVSTSTTVSPTVSATSMQQAPSSLTVTSIGGTATLSWSAPSAPAGASFSYTVARSGGTGSMGGGCAAGSLTATTCQDTSATAGQTYTWTVTPHIGANWTGKATAQVTAKAAGAVSKFAVALPSSSTAGDALTATVTAQDSLGDTVTGYVGSVAFTSTDAQAALPGSTAFVAGDKGVHTFTNAVTLKTAGAQTVTVTDTAASSATGTSASTSVSAATPSKLVFVTDPAGAVAGAAFTTQPVVNIDDQFGNLTTSTASVGIALGSNPAGGTLSGCANTTAVAGVVSVTGCAIDKAGTYTLTASSNGLTGATSNSFAVTANVAVVMISGADVNSNSQNWKAKVSVTVQDLLGNALNNYAVTISLSAGGSVNCTTGASGQCTTGQSSNIPASTTSVTAKVASVAKSGGGGLDWDPNRGTTSVQVNE